MRKRIAIIAAPLLAAAVPAVCMAGGLAQLPAQNVAPKTETTPHQQSTCLVALRDVAPGSIPAAGDFSAAECPVRDVAHVFSYDHLRHFSRLSRALKEGQIVLAYPEYESGALAPGEKAELVVLDGGVRIERDVRLMQVARPGQRVFVRTSEGDVVTAVFAGGQP